MQRLHVGFTGTRHGMTFLQQRTVADLLRHLAPSTLSFHHGDCVGADAEAHQHAKDLGLYIVRHPPERNKHRAFCEGANETRPPAPYLVRNRNLVEEVNLLIVAPAEREEIKRSGTWHTKRHAALRSVTTIIVYPETKQTCTQRQNKMDKLCQH